MANYFEKCHKCTPPMRHPGCQDHCKFYKEARAKFDADKARNNKDISVKYYISEQIAGSMDGVAKYAKRRPRNARHK